MRRRCAFGIKELEIFFGQIREKSRAFRKTTRGHNEFHCVPGSSEVNCLYLFVTSRNLRRHQLAGNNRHLLTLQSLG